MERTDRVDLAHVPSFGLGQLNVLPGVHELVRDDGKREILQHRVMQVLVALARADGAIVTREELTMSCWDGRVVGEDAINRILSRLRAVASGIGAGSFRIETVTRVGYRLLREGEASADIAFPSTPLPPRATQPSRRALLASGGAALALLGGGGWWFWRRGAQQTAPPAGVAQLMAQAWLALRQDTREGQNQAIGLCQRVVALEPDFPDGWGALGIAYAFTARFRERTESAMLRGRARAAGQRALLLAANNAFGIAALAMAKPTIGHWLETQQALRQAIDGHQEADVLPLELSGSLSSVGRNVDALLFSNRVAALGNSTPDLYFIRIRQLWAVGRLEEADRLAEEARLTYPTHFAVWFTRFSLFLFTGRPRAAIAMGEDHDTWPTGIAETEVNDVLAVARAAQSRTPDAIAAVMATEQARAHRGCGYAENAMQFACLFGRVDDAFALAEAYFFGRGFIVPDLRFTREQNTYAPVEDRLTPFLFATQTAPMRADPRFAALVTELGLARYWAESGSRPDYQRG